MFTKEELELLNAILTSDINLPVKLASLIVSIKNKVENELKTHEEIKG